MRILAVFAHPDDEAFGPSGTLSGYALTGHTVRLVTMTRGEAGTLGPAQHLSREELGRLRSGELRCSAAALHLSELLIHDYPDGKLSELPAEEGVNILRREIEAWHPDILITFHCGGISGHPDHQAISRWCIQAVREEGVPPRLFAFGISEEQARRAHNKGLIPIPDDEITHVIDVTPYLKYKLDAIGCHQSQSAAWEKMKHLEGSIESYFRNEHFSQVWPESFSRMCHGRLED